MCECIPNHYWQVYFDTNRMRFDPEATEWWLIPSADWPAYKFGKLFFDVRPRKLPPGLAAKIYCGFYIEKGLGLSYSRIEPHYTMGSDWLWSKFVAGIKAGFPAVHGGEVLTVWVGPFYRRDEIPYSQVDLYSYSRACFVVRNQNEIEPLPSASEFNVAQPEFATYLKQCVATARDVSSLSSALANFPKEYESAWVDLCVGPVLGSGCDNSSAARLWHDYLAPWAHWLRAG